MSQRKVILLTVVLSVLLFVAVEADIGIDVSQRHHFYNSTLLTSFKVAYSGDIELDDAGSAIVRMSPDAVLDIRQRVISSRRRLEVRPDENGQPTYQFKVGARQRPSAEAEEYLASVLPRVRGATTVGAAAQARRLLDHGGSAEVLAELVDLESNAARLIYLDVAAQDPAMTRDRAVAIVRTAGEEITSGSRLRRALVELAGELSSEWALGEEFARASESIGSSSERADALIEIARLRPPSAGEAEAFGEAAAGIASSWEKTRAVLEIHSEHPTPEIAAAFLETADTVDSSSDRRRLITELAGGLDLDETAYAEALQVTSGIPSSWEKAETLATLAEILPASDALHRDFIRVSRSVSGSEQQRRALQALMTASWLSVDSCSDWVDAAGDVASGRVASDLLIESTVWCPSGDRLWDAYLAAVDGLASSHDKRRALIALLDRHDLSPQLLGRLEALAATISSRSEREAVLDRLAVLGE